MHPGHPAPRKQTQGDPGVALSAPEQVIQQRQREAHGRRHGPENSDPTHAVAKLTTRWSQDQSVKSAQLTRRWLSSMRDGYSSAPQIRQIPRAAIFRRPIAAGGAARHGKEARQRFPHPTILGRGLVWFSRMV